MMGPSTIYKLAERTDWDAALRFRFVPLRPLFVPRWCGRHIPPRSMHHKRNASIGHMIATRHD